MSKTNDKLSEILDVEPIVYDNSEIIGTEIVETTETPLVKTTVEDDAEYARNNIKALIEKGNIAMDNLLLVAKESDHPRAYEVAAGFLKGLTDMNKDLLEIQKRKRDLEPKQVNNTQNINVDNAVFVGSTTELLKQLKGIK